MRLVHVRVHVCTCVLCHIASRPLSDNVFSITRIDSTYNLVYLFSSFFLFFDFVVLENEKNYFQNMFIIR